MPDIFDESWHKVASLNVSLSHLTDIHKQVYKGQTWYVLQDPYNTKFFRVRPEAYTFLIHLKASRTVEEVWDEMVEKYPDSAPSQTEVLQLLSQLHQANLLYFKSRPDHDIIFKRYKTKQFQSLLQKLITFLYIRIPLLDPDRWLDRMRPVISLLCSKSAVLIWLVVVMLGVKSVIDHADLLGSQIQGVLAPDNLLLLFISMAVLKLLHELGHAFIAKYYGGSVNILGIMLLVFTPLPYVDVSSSWAFRHKFQRMLVSSGGMYVELFIAAVAAIIWVNTDDGLIHNLSFNIMFIGSVSSILFNGNPLLKFDAYYILSDYWEIPNLQKQAQQQWYYWVEKYVFGLSRLQSPGVDSKEKTQLASYAVLSLLYRWFITIGIVLFVADQWFEVGVLIALISVYLFIIKPVYQFLKYLFFADKLFQKRIRAMTASLVFVFLVLVVIGMVPLANSVKVPGILSEKDSVNVYAESEGFLHKVFVSHGQKLEKGDLIAILRNEEIDLDIQIMQAKLDEINNMLLKARKQQIADIKSLKKHLGYLETKIQILKEKQQNLHIYAQQQGVWFAPELQNKTHTWMTRQQLLGVIYASKHYEFIAVVSQTQAFDLFKMIEIAGEVKITGSAQHTFASHNLHVIPYEQTQLPSAALGWMGGGDIAIDMADPNGTKSLEPFFEIRAKLPSELLLSVLSFNQGRSGFLKIDLPDATLWQRAVKMIQQLMQKRYRI